MTEKIIKGINLDMRSIALFAQTAGKFTSEINIIVDERSANAKSIMGIMSLNFIYDKPVKITARGEDEKQAITALSSFMARKANFNGNKFN